MYVGKISVVITTTASFRKVLGSTDDQHRANNKSIWASQCVVLVAEETQKQRAAGSFGLIYISPHTHTYIPPPTHHTPPDTPPNDNHAPLPSEAQYHQWGNWWLLPPPTPQKFSVTIFHVLLHFCVQKHKLGWPVRSGFNQSHNGRAHVTMII